MANEIKEYRYKYPNESFSGCDMTASIVYGWDRSSDSDYNNPNSNFDGGAGKDAPIGKSRETVQVNPTDPANNTKRWNTKVLGEIQTISYSIHMEKRPVRSIGNVNAKDYVMGPRTIAGSLVFAVFNKHFAKDIIADHNDYFKEGTAFIVDELPPFNIVISMANEYGLRSKLVIYGVRLLNEGQVMSVNDVYTENTYQFVATDIEYLNDEVKYATRKKDAYWIKIQDYVSKKDEDMHNALDGRVEVKYHDPNANDIERIVMTITTTDATNNNPNGRANISLHPIQTEGVITIKDSNTNYTKDNPAPTIQMNGSNSYSIDLPPELYSASFDKPNPGKWYCMSKNFLISKAKDKYEKQKYSPVIEKITDTSLKIYSNEPTHTHIIISEADSNEETFYNLKSRRVEIKDLKADTEYSIASCTGEDTIKSPYIKVRTYKVFEKPFIDFKKMIETNRHLLLYNEIDRYNNIIDLAVEKAERDSKFESPTNSIIELKNGFEKELASLDKDAEDYQDRYSELTYNIHACNELIHLSNKVQNNILSIVNKSVEIPAPELILDKSYDTIFKFNEDIEKAEFFRVVRGMAQTSNTVYSNTFANIDGNDNSVKYKGKSGTNHYVQALIGSARSPKLEFYEMTVKEKQDKINNDLNKEVMTENDIFKINSIISEELNANSSSSLFDRAFMIKTKQLENPLLLGPNVITKEDDYIEVTTKISDMVNDSSIDFYLSIARVGDIINNDYIYKHKFTCLDSVIKLQDVDYALYHGQDYSLWIEDKDFNQISNVTTFRMQVEEIAEDREALEYELTPIINNIKRSLDPILPSTIYETMCSYIEYNDDINKDNVIDRTVEYLLYSGLGKSTLNNSLKAINHLIGTMSASDDILASVSYNNNTLMYDCNKDVNTLVISYKDELVNYNLFHSNVIDINFIDAEYIFVMGLSSDLKYKTKIMFIDKNTNDMEVL